MRRDVTSPFSSIFASGPKGASFSFWIGTPLFRPKLRPWGYKTVQFFVCTHLWHSGDSCKRCRNAFTRESNQFFVVQPCTSKSSKVGRHSTSTPTSCAARLSCWLSSDYSSVTARPVLKHARLVDCMFYSSWCTSQLLSLSHYPRRYVGRRG